MVPGLQLEARAENTIALGGSFAASEAIGSYQVVGWLMYYNRGNDEKGKRLKVETIQTFFGPLEASLSGFFDSEL